jgi:hypothetical protein
MSQQPQTAVQLPGVVHRLMHHPQPLSAEILRRNGNHDGIGGQHRVPTAQIQVGRAVDQHDVVGLQPLQVGTQRLLLEPCQLGRWRIVGSQRVIGRDERDPLERSGHCDRVG